MRSARRPLLVSFVLVAAGLVVAGCGGGGDAGAAGATPTPGDAAGGSTVAATDPAAAGGAGAIDPATGLPVDPAAGSATTATVPELVGDDVSGGLDPLTGEATLFDTLAVSEEKFKGSQAKDETTTTEAKPETPVETEPAVSFSGAKIYVDGIVHTVDINGTFPKGAPVFRLLSVNDNDIEIALLAGEFTSSGGDGTFLDKGDLVSLVNSSEQVTYRVKYLRGITSTSDITF
jgi:hypothetical protein